MIGIYNFIKYILKISIWFLKISKTCNIADKFYVNVVMSINGMAITPLPSMIFTESYYYIWIRPNRYLKIVYVDLTLKINLLMLEGSKTLKKVNYFAKNGIFFLKSMIFSRDYFLNLLIWSLTKTYWFNFMKTEWILCELSKFEFFAEIFLPQRSKCLRTFLF